MEKLTYKQAYDKIIQAYFKDEIKPYNGNFCFCGTLAKENNWRWAEGNDYTPLEFGKMEYALLKTIFDMVGGEDDIFEPFRKDPTCERTMVVSHPNYEAALFAGMSAALEVLKEIHRARGEDVDEVPMFTKRELLTPAH